MQYLLIIFLFVSTVGVAQDKIMLMNGKIKTVGKVLEIKDRNVLYQAKGSKRIKKMGWEKVFSIETAAGREQVVYLQDSTISNDLSIEQMRLFVKGEQAAIYRYKSPLSTIGGLVFGAAGGLLVPYFPAVSVLPPAAGITALAFVKPKSSKKSIVGIPDEVSSSPEFVAGYQRKAKDKRMNNTLKGAAVGFLLTVGAIVAFRGL